MNLFYTINDAFVPQLGAAVCSVCENNRDAEEIIFYIGALRVSLEHQRQLRELAARYDREIRFLPIDQIRDRMGFDFDTLGWSEVVVARLLIDELMPPEVRRVLYLDGDTIVRGSLRELWETDMRGKPLGASIEPTANHGRKKALGLEFEPYYNSGVLLIDLDAWRERGVANRVLAFYRAHDGRLFAPDQDALNGGLKGDIFPLSPKYNFYNIYWYYSYQTLVRIERPAPYISEEIFQDAAENPVIIHYLGEDRPWRRGNTHRYTPEYQKYLAMTPWKDTPPEEGWETYFRFYGAFWKILKPFPLLQYHIIDGLIPLVMKRRKKKREKQEKAGDGRRLGGASPREGGGDHG